MTAIKEKLRKDLTNEFMSYLISQYGENNVSQIAPNKIAAAVGETKDDDGFLQEVCAVISISAKSWEDSKGDKRKTLAFDRFQAAEDYQNELKTKKMKQKLKDMNDNEV